MAYIERKDYLKQIKSDTLDDIVQKNEYLLDEAEAISKQEAKSYLVGRYDIDEEFKKNAPTKQGGTDSRNPQLVMWIIDIALYHLHSRINPRNIPELRVIRYDGNDPKQNGGAIGALKMATGGKITLDLPTYPEEEKDTGIRFGGDDTFEGRPFGVARRRSLGDNRLVKTNYKK